MATFEAITGTDGQYNVYDPIGGAYMGQIRKVYMGRSAYLWTIDPVNFEQRHTLRVGYSTRKAAFNALSKYTEHPYWRSLVEG